MKADPYRFKNARKNYGSGLICVVETHSGGVTIEIDIGGRRNCVTLTIEQGIDLWAQLQMWKYDQQAYYWQKFQKPLPGGS